jgi:hypothetical protein
MAFQPPRTLAPTCLPERRAASGSQTSSLWALSGCRESASVLARIHVVPPVSQEILNFIHNRTSFLQHRFPVLLPAPFPSASVLPLWRAIRLRLARPRFPNLAYQIVGEILVGTIDHRTPFAPSPTMNSLVDAHVRAPTQTHRRTHGSYPGELKSVVLHGIRGI